MKLAFRTFSAIALLTMCEFASSAPADPSSAHGNDDGAVQRAEADDPTGLHQAAMADADAVESVTKPITLAGDATTASAEDAAHSAGEPDAGSGRRLTLRQKRIFVLGLAAQENQ